MKKIALISDTHGYLGEEIHKYLRDADEVWHAGDVGSVEVVEELEKNYALRAVFGNIDNHEIRAMIPEHNYFELEGVKVLITHIAGRPGKYYRQGAEALEKYPCDVFVCGHSHTLLVQQDKRFKCLWLNPGACGKKGFHKVRTLLLFDLDQGKVLNMRAVELND